MDQLSKMEIEYIEECRNAADKYAATYSEKMCVALYDMLCLAIKKNESQEIQDGPQEIQGMPQEIQDERRETPIVPLDSDNRKMLAVPCTLNDTCIINVDGKDYKAKVCEIKLSNDFGLEFKANTDEGKYFSFDESEIGESVILE